MPTPKEHIVRPDAKGRITLGSFAKGVSSFRVREDKQHRIILEPYIEIPANIPEREKWLYRNPKAMKALLTGIEQAGRGELHYLGSFAQYLDDENE